MPWEPIAEVAVKLGIDAVKKFFEGKKDDKDLISVGLAVGYFYNFLNVISGVIQNNQVTLYEKAGDKDGRHFERETVAVQVILPGRLDTGVFERCDDEFRKTNKSFILLEGQGRMYGINYNPIQRGDKAGIVIVDLARPLMSVKRFYEDILHYPTHDDADAKWIKAQKSEIVAFKETLLQLQKRGYGALVNRLAFIEIA